MNKITCGAQTEQDCFCMFCLQSHRDESWAIQIHEELFVWSAQGYECGIFNQT